jgi:gamma-glutamylcyclotransferase (GGCT)/AIG2-like uncharacterized protein YtfP
MTGLATAVHWSADQWSAFGTVTLAGAAVFGGMWALYNYWKQRRIEAAHWVHDLFRDFYIADRYRDIKWQLIRPTYHGKIAPILERRLANRDLPLEDDEDQLLRDLDTLLNFFEHILYLESQRHLRKRDREAMFNYWISLLSAPDYAAVRKYLARFDYEQLAAQAGASDIDYVAVYGVLRSDVNGLLSTPEPDLASRTISRGKCLIPGALFDVGDYPGLVPGDGIVEGELLEISHESVLADLDHFEGYDPGKPYEGKFRRQLVRLRKPSVDAWIYVYTKESADLPCVPQGDWKAYIEARQTP